MVLRNNDYTVGWICAIVTEFVAAQVFLDEKHGRPEQIVQHDNNSYALGRISGHNVVIAVLPEGEYGTASAASVARDMLHSFPSVRIGLMVGIGGGAPSARHDIRLGDVVVGTTGQGYGGVFQYDFGKNIQDQEFETTRFLNQAPTILRTAVSGLKADYEMDDHQIQRKIEDILHKRTQMQSKYQRPKPETDRLYRFDVIHPSDGIAACETSCDRDASALLSRRERRPDELDPAIHYGLIASANQLMKDAVIRDKWANEKDVLCFEMEAAGLTNHFPCLVIRGICDYADTHKNKQWQGYAAMAAAAYAKDLLGVISPTQVNAVEPLSTLLEKIRLDQKHIRESTHITGTVVKELQTGEQFERIRQWLSPPDPSINLHMACNRHQEGTCNWFLQCQEYDAWKCERNSFLWLNGMAGCGKTILSSCIIADIEPSPTSPQNLLYFFFDFNDIEKQSLEKAVRSLVHQLYFKRPDLREDVDALHLSCQNGGTQPGNHLYTLLETLLVKSGELYIVMDALDECLTRNETSTHKLLRWIDGLRDLDLNIHILATSRPEQDISSSIKCWDRDKKIIELQGSSVNEDISAFIQARVQDMKRWDPAFQQEIGTALLKKANGMFRLISCYLDALDECLEKESVKEELEKLPQSLHGMYKRMLDNVKEQHRHHATRLLQFLVYSDRPLRLEEAVDAVAVNTFQKPHFQEANRLPLPHEIIRYCSSLVTLVEREPQKDGTKVEEIQLAHLSVKEYLTGNQPKGFLDKNLEKSNAAAAILETCLFYLMDIDYVSLSYFSLPLRDRRWNDRSIHEARTRYPLATYAAEFWLYYASIVEDSTKQAPDVVLQYLFWEHFASVQYFYSRHLKFGSSGQWLFLTEREEHVKALRCVSSGGLFYTTQALLEQGADSNEECGNKYTALSAASELGNLEIVQLLIQHDTDMNPLFDYKYAHNSLQHAAKKGHTEIVRALLECGAELDACNGIDGNALHSAARGGHTETVQLLLDYGADIDKDEGWSSALSIASGRGHAAIVRLLLDRGANRTLQFPARQWKCALGSAARNDDQRITEMLLEHCAVTVQDPAGWSVSIAASKGDIDRLEMLLTSGADLKREYPAGHPLCRASDRGHLRMVEMLLKRGADVNVQMLNSGSSLIRASHSGHYEVVEMLLKWGADINAQCDFGNALSKASEGGHVDIVLMLLDHGAEDVEETGLKVAIGREARSFAHTQIADILRYHSIISRKCKSTASTSASMSEGKRIRYLYSG